MAEGRSYFLKISLCIIGMLCLVLLWGWIKDPPKPKAIPQAMSVVAATASTLDVPVTIVALGAVTPLDTVTVKTQIGGQLLKVLFKEGQSVKKGELLAQIDPRPYQALLTQYQGQLARDRALLADARLDRQRYRTLWKQDSIAKQTLDTQEWLVKQYEGTVKSDEGLVQTAKIDLLYCKIISPINGRIGLRLVDPGNFVQTTDTTGLFVLTTLRPITVVFTIAEDYIPQVIDQMKIHKQLSVQAFDRAQNKLLDTGTLYALDNQIDPTTGTVKLKALFQNKNDVLFPNQFVNVNLLVKTLHNACVVPTPSILQGPQGHYVYVYHPETKTVQVRSVKTGIVSGNNTVISDGIKPGEQVITEGTDKLIDGALVSVTEHHQTPAASSHDKQVSGTS